MTILVTGSAGFIGFHTVNRLLSDGNSVVGVDSINDYYDVQLKYARLSEAGITVEEKNAAAVSNRNPSYTFYQIQLENYESLQKIFDTHQFDYVIHLAAQAGVRYSLINPHAYIQSNIVAFTNLLECCRHHQIKHLEYASSSSVYGLNDEVPFATSQNVDHPISLYAASKKSNELMAHVYSHLFQLPTTGLRFFTVYGPWGRPDMALFLFTKAILENRPIQVFNNGNMQRDFTYIDDIVEGVVRVMEHIPQPNAEWRASASNASSSSAPYKIYNIGNNAPVQLMHFIDAIENELGKKAVKELSPLQPGDVPATYADVIDLVRDIQYRPNTSLSHGVKKFIEWYRKYYRV
ncbi:MAG TPA: NAD-dependent epimerase [Panacibacter sp.]|nr:NAD-dependent epimerase [Panacibacter sp.]